MKKKLIQLQLCVKQSPIHRYGVFANQFIQKNQVIEECVVLHTNEVTKNFQDYYFRVNEHSSMILGFGAIYNHSDRPNATFVYNVDHDLMEFIALRDIHIHEEILVNYGEDWVNTRPQFKLKRISAWRRFLNPATSVVLRAGFVTAVVYGCIGLFKYLLLVHANIH